MYTVTQKKLFTFSCSGVFLDHRVCRIGLNILKCYIIILVKTTIVLHDCLFPVGILSSCILPDLALSASPLFQLLAIMDKTSHNRNNTLID